MDRRNWPWRKKSSSNIPAIMNTYSALDVTHHPNSGIVSPSSKASPSVEASGDVKPSALLMSAEKKRHASLLENAKAFEALAWKEQAEQKVKALTQKLADAEKDLVRKEQLELKAKDLAQKLVDAEKDLASKEAMVKQHAKVAEEAVSGWETAEAEAVSLRQELAASLGQRNLLEKRIVELEEALKSSFKQSRQVHEEHQQRIQEAIDRNMQEWGKAKAEMEEVEHDLQQRMLTAEAQSCAMAKSLEERARAITECQEGKARAEMEAGLLQVKLESQATEMAAVRYEVRVLTKELEIRNQENERSRKAADAAHKQHLEDMKKITMLDSECQRLRNIVRRKLPGPAAIAQMKMEADKSEQSKRRRSLGSCGAGAHFSVSPSQSSHVMENRNSSQDLEQKLLVLEEETKTLREALAKRSNELYSARLMCARTANKLSAAEEQLESLQGTPKSVRSTQNSALDTFISQSQAMSGADSERLDDEVSCAESWASALITELAHFTKVKQFTDSCGLDSTPDRLSAMPKKSTTDSIETSQQATHASPSSLDYSTLRILAGKDAQLQSANLMCKDAMAKLASAEAKLGGTWVSENPRSNVEESLSSMGEAHGIMSKLDRILDDMRIAVASVGDSTDDDNSDNGLLTSSQSGKGTVNVAASSNLNSLKDQIQMQARTNGELQTQVAALETVKSELETQLNAKGEELKQVKSELDNAQLRIEELQALQFDLQSQKDKRLAEEETRMGEMQTQLEAKQSELSKLQNSVTSLGADLSEQRKKNEAMVAKYEELDKKLLSYVDREQHSMATSCRFEEALDPRARKEREVAVAKEKLAECQRTIMVLGKQLTAFTSPSSASFDSTMSSHYGPMDTNHHQESDHVYKLHARMQQRRPLAYNSVKPHDDGTDYSTVNIPISDAVKRPLHGNGEHYSKPRRIHSDLSYRTGLTNPVTGMAYSVAEHLQMDDGVSSFYDSRTESAMSSPSSQYTSPNDAVRVQRTGNEGAVRASLAKSLERVAVQTSVEGKSSVGRGGNEGKISTHVIPAKNGSYGGGGGKGNKSLSRFFGRSKK